MLAASAGAPIAEPAPTIVCASSTNRIRFGPLLDLADDVVEAVLEHAAQHRAGHEAVHLQVDDLAVAQPAGNRVGLELDAPRQPFDDGRLADAGLADQHHGVRPLAVREDLEHLLNLVRRGRRPAESGPAAPAGSGWSRSCAGTAAARTACGTALRAARDRACAWQCATTSASGSTPCWRMMLTGTDDGPRLSSKSGHEQVGRFEHLAAGPAGVVKRELQHVLRRRRRTRGLPGRSPGRLVQVILERLDDLVRVQARGRASTSENVSHSSWAKARNRCSLVTSPCSRRRVSSTARSTTRWADSPILL